ncbi:MAG: alpha/beta hydrolase, partial [Burkholderiales bacterium]|nr:alpha/beta hydrolase [Anaerolineae bacterium]
MKMFHNQLLRTLSQGLCVVFTTVVLGGLFRAQAQDQNIAGEDDLIVGMFDIGGLELYLRCEGTGSPTIIYLHGSIKDEQASGADSALYIQSQMRESYRFCIYDRRNVGRSDQVEGYWTGMTAVDDLHALLEEANVEPPYVFLAASFG